MLLTPGAPFVFCRHMEVNPKLSELPPLVFKTNVAPSTSLLNGKL